MYKDDKKSNKVHLLLELKFMWGKKYLKDKSYNFRDVKSYEEVIVR